MKKVIYNVLKLPEHRALFHNKKVLVVGAGAVGSYEMEFLAKEGMSPDVIDFDRYTRENGAKISSLIRMPEDDGRNKAQCASERVQVLLDEGCSSNGVDTELSKLGPEAFADYDIVFISVDNFDAKVLINELVRQLPEDRRPILVMNGTSGELAQSTILDNKDFCIRCLIDDSWMRDSSIRTSCTGPQVRTIDGVPEIVRTSPDASAIAALLSRSQYLGHAIGCEDAMNRRVTFTNYPNLELFADHPMKQDNCPGCAVKPPEHLEVLKGTVLTKTLGETLAELEEQLGSKNFELLTHRLNYRKTIHSQFVVDDICHSCGKPMRVMKHDGRMFMSDLICESCAKANRPVNNQLSAIDGLALRAFTPESCEELKAMTLYELGFPLGAHLEVLQRSSALSFLDRRTTTTVFYCAEDRYQLHTIDKL